MKVIKKFILLLIFFFSSPNYVFANESYMFLNIDLLIKETNIGKNSLKKIGNIDKENLKKLNKYEAELVKIENEIKIKKNIISEEEYKNEVNQLKLKLKKYNDEKNLMVQDLNNVKKKEMKIFFDTINPILQEYMKQNSIDIIFDKKNIFIGNKKLDLTQSLIDEINSKIK
ncbi:OmpH family outer membrane protein [Candidatus Pelagibacter sp. HIMB1593]|uniref:OmpH family outer membrane protein n=1 Tax=Candidatus Pelagibacter sp. HIMB1593 TaxID=3413355 RepID=UPI003F8543CD